MKAVFQIEADSPRQVEVDFNTLIVAGWAGRDIAAIEHHIEELAAIGVPRPTSVPLYYRIADNQLTQAERVQAVGGDSSGEVETFVFSADGEMYVSIASDHTDRKLETVSVAMSKPVSYTHLIEPPRRSCSRGLLLRRMPMPRVGRTRASTSTCLLYTSALDDEHAFGRQVAAFGRVDPVSYTHLDVYKRQTPGCGPGWRA